MNKKKFFIAFLVIAMGAGFGAIFNNSFQKEKSDQVRSTELKSDELVNKERGVASNKPVNKTSNQEVSLKPKKIEFKKTKYKENEYLKYISKDPGFEDVFHKAMAKFGNFEFAEDLAVWLAIGVIFDSSPEYGVLFENSIAELNSQKDEVYSAVSQTMNSIGPEDSFLRQQLINVVGVMDLEKEKKVSFFGSEASREVVLDQNGDFSPDSMNITNSIAFLKHSGSSLDEVKKVYEKSILANPDPKIQKELMVRFNTYFPGSVDI